MERYEFNMFNDYSICGITQALKNINNKNKTPIIVCVGTDLVLGDSLGPLIGTTLKKNNLRAYVYGTLNSPITAKEVNNINTYIKKMHPNALIIAIDAAVGKKDELGLIKVINGGLKPGLGVNKDLDKIGDISIVGVVAEKSPTNYNLYNLTRLNMIYKQSEIICQAIKDYIVWRENYDKKISQAL